MRTSTRNKLQHEEVTNRWNTITVSNKLQDRFINLLIAGTKIYRNKNRPPLRNITHLMEDLTRFSNIKYDK